MRKDKSFEETAAELAAPYLSKPDTERVFVNDKGCVWVNNEVSQMDGYFKGRGEKYVVFEKDAKTAESPASTEGDAPAKPVKKGKKSS